MYKFFKRTIDIIVSAIALVVLAPLFLFVSLILMFTGEREVFYLQRRIGYKNEPFYVYKFATMVKNSLNIGTRSITLRNDPRVTPVGRYLRKAKINELPQLLNVFIGQMSLVGPRPFVDETFAAYPVEIQNRVYNCKPGLTGIGSIIYRDEESIISSSDMEPAECYRRKIAPHKGELELWYQDHQSFTVDILLLLLTVLVVIAPDSRSIAYQLFKSLPRSGDVEPVSIAG